MEKLKSRKFWVAIGAAAVSVANAIWDLGLDPEAGIGLAVVLGTYLLGQSWVDRTEVETVIKAEVELNKQRIQAQLVQLANQAQAEPASPNGEVVPLRPEITE